MILGIDLGTTNSLACVWREGKGELIPNSFQEVLTPSVVGLDEEGNIIVGKLAKERLLTHPDKTISNFKRFMGTDKKLKLGEQEYLAEELSSFLLRKLVEDAELYLKEKVEELVISVPAYFSDTGRGATKNAGHLAGHLVERIINEPSAAALSYHLNQGEDATYMVIDLGGGTLDVSVVDSFENIIEIVAVAGDNHLGGEDFTEAIIQGVLRDWNLSWEELTGEEKERLHQEAERGKLVLNERDEVELKEEIAGEERVFSLSFTEYFQWTKPLLQRVESCIQRAIQDSRGKLVGVEQIVLVGGGAKLRVFQEFIRYIFEDKEILLNNPDLSIALGCGMVSGIKGRKEEIKDILLTDICPFSLGIEISDGSFSPIIERNSPLPFSKEGYYQTAELGQKEISFPIYQGDHYIAKENILIGELAIPVPVNRKEHERICLRFTYDINGILEVDCKVLSNGNQVNKRILSKSYQMNEEELNQRIEALQRIKLHPREQEKNEYLLEKAKGCFERTLGVEREELVRLIRSFEKALDQQEPREIQFWYKVLEQFIGGR